MARTHATTRRAETDRRLGFGSCALAPKERKAKAAHGWRRLLAVANEEMALDAVLSGEDAACEAQWIEEEEQRMREVDRAMQDAFVEACCAEARGDVQDAGEEFLEETARGDAQACAMDV